MSSTWQQIAANKKKEQSDSIPKHWLITPPPQDQLNVLSVPAQSGLLTPLELEITENIDISLLLNNLATGVWSAVQVTTAFYKRAIIAQQLTNCLTEIYIDKALKWASDLDEHLTQTGQVVGPLHGLPISIKDQLCIAGMDTVMGYVSWVDKPATKNAILVDILLSAGAIPFVRTNVPQTLMWPETNNMVYGRTTNPHNRSLTSGGSSGGEGALVALKGSPLGVGSDIGGSVRIPSNFNGLFGLRPSYNRIPYEGGVNSMLGQESVYSVFGPLCHSMEGVKLFFKTVVNSKPWLWDPLALRIPFDEQMYRLAEHGDGKKLAFGFMYDDGFVKPHPPILRALQMTKDALLAAGHEVIDWAPYKHGEFYEVLGAIWGADGGEDFDTTAATTGEPVLHTMLPGSPVDIPEPPAYRKKTKRTAYELWQVHLRKQILRKEYLDRWQATRKFTSTGRAMDAIICPAAAYAAPPHGLNTSAGYTMIWNALDYPACVFPVTKVDPVLDRITPPPEFLSKEDQKNYELYDPAVFKDAPIGLQVVGLTQDDEAVIAMTEIVHAALIS